MWVTAVEAAVSAYIAEAQRRRPGNARTPALHLDPEPPPSSAGAVWWANMLGIALLVALLVVAGLVVVGHG